MIWLKMDVTSLNQSIFCRKSKFLRTCIVKLMLPGFPGIFSGNPGISRSREENISGRNANPNPIETTTVEMEKLEDLEPNDISLEENNQASLKHTKTKGGFI